MNAVLENIKTRRSVREYLDKNVKKEDLDQILEAGLYAPSARNTQNWQFTVVQKSENLKSLNDVMAEALGREYNKFYDAPVLIIVSVPRDYKHGMADTSVALQNMMLAANSLELGSVWVNQLLDVGDHAKVRAILTNLGVPEDHIVNGSLAVGYSKANIEKDRKNRGVVVFD